MITRISPEDKKEAWQEELARAITDPAELYRRLKLDSAQLPAALTAHRDFRLRVTESFLANMEPGNPHDPLLLQVLPQALEMSSAPGYVSDPVGDDRATQAAGTLHKYQGRVLLITTPACAIHCRYCFRRHYPYSESSAARDQWQGALDYLKSQNDVDEVILSGGDPLTLSDRRLAALIHELEQIAHLQTLRIHTRLPLVLPSRITDRLLDLLNRTRLQAVMVIHCNHPQEISADVGHALNRLSRCGISLLNQAVLLKNVNNDTTTLKNLSKSLFKWNVLPYYLHVLDKVKGAAHFDVSESEATELLRTLRQELPGYLVPRLVREIAGETSKTPIG